MRLEVRDGKRNVGRSRGEDEVMSGPGLRDGTGVGTMESS